MPPSGRLEVYKTTDYGRHETATGLVMMRKASIVILAVAAGYFARDISAYPGILSGRPERTMDYSQEYGGWYRSTPARNFADRFGAGILWPLVAGSDVLDALAPRAAYLTSRGQYMREEVGRLFPADPAQMNTFSSKVAGPLGTGLLMGLIALLGVAIVAAVRQVRRWARI